MFDWLLFIADLFYRNHGVLFLVFPISVANDAMCLTPLSPGPELRTDRCIDIINGLFGRKKEFTSETEKKTLLVPLSFVAIENGKKKEIGQVAKS